MNAITQREEEIFDAARHVADSVARASLLDQACGSNSELRSRLDRLMASAAAADQFFTESGTALSVSGTPLHSTHGTATGSGANLRALPGEEKSARASVATNC